VTCCVWATALLCRALPHHVCGRSAGSPQRQGRHTAGRTHCSYLQLTHRGLPCKHYFAVLLHDQGLQSDVSVIPAGFTQSTARSLVKPTPAATCSLPVDAERLKAVQYMTTDIIKAKIEQLSGNVRGLKSKGDYVERPMALEASDSTRSPATATEVVDVASG